MNDMVALRKESVDRNSDFVRLCLKMRSVALRKESVDRNSDCRVFAHVVAGRSPQGERG